MNETIDTTRIENDTEFYGFLNKLNATIGKMTADTLSHTSLHKLGECWTKRGVAEEIVRRGGEFYDPAHAKEIAPQRIAAINYSGRPIYARVRYLENEPHPEDIEDADYNWIPVDVLLYSYASHLQKQIEKGLLTPEDIVVKP